MRCGTSEAEAEASDPRWTVASAFSTEERKRARRSAQSFTVRASPRVRWRHHANVTRRPRPALQVIHQFATEVTEIKVKYPEPANLTVTFLAVFSLQFLSFAPPECANPDATVYTKLLVMTIGPFLVPPVIHLYYACLKRHPSARYKTMATSIAFFELVLCSVTTAIFRIFACASFDGVGSYLKAQLNLSCEYEGNPERRWYVAYASLMVLVYPCAVPLGTLTVLYSIRKSMKSTMERARMKCQRLGAPSLCQMRELIAQDPNVSDLVRSMSFIFEKYESDAWCVPWLGLLFMR